MDDKEKIRELLREIVAMRVLLAMAGYTFVTEKPPQRPPQQEPERVWLNR